MKSCLHLLILMWFVGCDPQIRIAGRIVDGGSASVKLVCPSRARVSVESETVSNTDGEFVFEGVGCLPNDCRVVAQGKSALVGSGCRHTARGCARDRCTDAELTIDLLHAQKPESARDSADAR